MRSHISFRQEINALSSLLLVLILEVGISKVVSRVGYEIANLPNRVKLNFSGYPMSDMGLRK